jgi:PAS domain S-box-containing protein
VGVSHVDVPSDVESVPAARRAAAAALREAGVPEAVLDAAELVVGELVANAVLHGAAPVRLTVAVAGDGTVRLEVSDGSRALPVRARASLEGLTGRGLGLVDAVATAWGVDAVPHGKAVWVELTAASVAAAQPGEASLDALLAGFPDWPDEQGRRTYRVVLEDVPTDLLVEDGAHVDSLVRELTLSETGARSGMSTRLPEHLVRLVAEVQGEFAEVRAAILRQATAAAERGEQRTTLSLSLAAEAADAGERYLAALERADAHAREERLLTLAAPPQQQAFRRWWTTSLVTALRCAAAGLPPTALPSFESHLLREIDRIAALQLVSERSARLQRVTAALTAALGRAEVGEIVLGEAVAELAADRGLLIVPTTGSVRPVAAHGYDDDAVARYVEAWRSDAALPGRAAWRTGEPVWVETREEQRERYPALADLDPTAAATCALPLPVAGHLAGVLLLRFREPRLFSEDERAFLTALAAVGAQAFERADLYDRQAELAAQLARLQQVTTALSDADEVEEVLDVVIAHATTLVGARNAAVCLLRDDGHTVETVRLVPDLGPDHDGWALFDVADPTPASEALRTGEVVFAADLAERDRRWPALARYARDFEHSLAVLPVHGQGRVLGVVSLSFPAVPGEEPALAYLQAFADSCGQALERARSAARLRGANARLTFLARASEELTSTLDVERTLAGLARLSVPDLADWCVIHLLQDGELRALAAEHVDPERTALVRGVQERWPSRLEDPGVGQVVRTGEPLLVPDIPALTAQVEAAGQTPQRDPEHQAVLDGLGLRSCIIVPLAARGRTLGALTFIAAESERTYDEDDLSFALDLARRAAVALDNARLFTAVSERAVRTGLPTGQEAGSEQGDAASTARLLETMTDAFFRLDREWQFAYVNRQAERMLLRGREELLGRGIWDEFPEAVGGPFQRHYERAVATGQQVTFESWFAPLRSWFEVRASPDAEGLSVFFHDVDARKRAEEERERAAARLALLADATRELVGALDPGTVLERLVRVLVPGLADWGVAALRADRDDPAPLVRSGHADPDAAARLADAVARRPEAVLGVPRVAAVLDSGEPQLVVSADGEQLRSAGPEVEELVRGLGFRSAMVLPLRSGDTTLGVLAVASGEGRPAFTADDLATAGDLGARAGLALQNALLFARQRAAVEVLQRSLLTALPEPEQLELVARYRAAAREAQVGGDWYDAFQQPDGATVVVIGDVMGHDVDAAAAMGQVRSLLRGTAYDRQESPARVLTRVDGALRGLRIDTLATALVARLEQVPAQRALGRTTLRWSSAGHPPAMLLRASGRVDVLGAEADLLLGLEAARRHDHTVEMGPGDTLLLYTDGLVERRDSPLAEGVERLRATLVALAGAPLEDLCDALLARLLPDAPDDDVALVAVRPRPVAVGGRVHRQAPPGARPAAAPA